MRHRPVSPGDAPWHRHATSEGMSPHRHADAEAGHTHTVPFRGITGPMVSIAGPGPCAVATAQAGRA